MQFSKPRILAAAFLLSAGIISCTEVTSDQSNGPTHLAYPAVSVNYAEGFAVTDTPTVIGTVSSYSVTPALPAGLSLNPSTGVISGTPTAVSATASYRVTAANGSDSNTTIIYITVYNAPPSNLSYADSSSSYIGGFYISANIPTVTGTVTGYSVSPALPPGILLNDTTGIISGTPTATSPATPYTVTASNALGSTTAAVTISVTWLLRTSGTGNGLNSVISSGSQFVVVGNEGTILTSPNGVVWAASTSGTADALTSVTWTGSQWVVVGKGDTILTSADGVTWAGHASGVSVLNSVAVAGVAGNQIVAVGDSGAIVTSPDGMKWTVQSSGTTHCLNSVIWAGSQWVAVGDSSSSGLILTSPDGVTWTEQNVVSQNLFSVTWTGSQLVAVGLQTILTSPDGVTWTPQASAPFSLKFVAWINNQLVAVGYGGGNVLTSPDGVTWTAGPSSQDYSLTSVASAGSQLVAVGGAGIILTSL